MKSFIVLGFIIAAVALASEHPPTPAATAPAAAVPLAVIRARGIMGELGVPLGTVVKAHAVVVSGDALNKKAAAGELFLRLDVVNGQRLKRPALLELTLHDLAKEKLIPPSPKEAITVTGWETGGYEGIVPHEFDYVAGYSGVAFNFQTHFVAVTISR